jgi:coenzyme PQQ precursor peptide PqqA
VQQPCGGSVPLECPLSSHLYRGGWNITVGEAAQVAIHTEKIMSWTTPRVVEISVGMEINCYACAEI